MCPGIMQKHLLNLYMSHTVAVLAREILMFFSNYKTAFCSKLAHIDGATLNNFGCVYLIETHAQ